MTVRACVCARACVCVCVCICAPTSDDRRKNEAVECHHSVERDTTTGITFDHVCFPIQLLSVHPKTLGGWKCPPCFRDNDNTLAPKCWRQHDTITRWHASHSNNNNDVTPLCWDAVKSVHQNFCARFYLQLSNYFRSSLTYRVISPHAKTNRAYNGASTGTIITVMSLKGGPVGNELTLMLLEPSCWRYLSRQETLKKHSPVVVCF